MRRDSADKSNFSDNEKKVLKRFRDIFDHSIMKKLAEKGESPETLSRAQEIYASLKLDQGDLKKILRNISNFNKGVNSVELEVAIDAYSLLLDHENRFKSPLTPELESILKEFKEIFEYWFIDPKTSRPGYSHGGGRSSFFSFFSSLSSISSSTANESETANERETIVELLKTQKNLDSMKPYLSGIEKTEIKAVSVYRILCQKISGYGTLHLVVDFYNHLQAMCNLIKIAHRAGTESSSSSYSKGVKSLEQFIGEIEKLTSDYLTQAAKFPEFTSSTSDSEPSRSFLILHDDTALSPNEVFAGEANSTIAELGNKNGLTIVKGLEVSKAKRYRSKIGLARYQETVKTDKIFLFSNVKISGKEFKKLLSNEAYHHWDFNSPMVSTEQRSARVPRRLHFVHIIEVDIDKGSLDKNWAENCKTLDEHILSFSTIRVGNVEAGKMPNDLIIPDSKSFINPKKFKKLEKQVEKGKGKEKTFDPQNELKL